MKHGKKPTRAQMDIIKMNGLNPNNWLVVKNLSEQMQVIHRETGRLRKLIV
ncbi:DUF6906 family protein [Bacillus gobiensis]|uniref:DUF6906 family protein n=1 Tax=Bacillus gobiensis TaxID=1441095 RepID=UPI000AF432C6|nr:hypothetical protein [Bacillus gobiensis]